MHIDTASLPPAAREHSRAPDTNRPFPGIPPANANEAATTRRPDAENPAVKANVAGVRELPAGLLAAQARFQARNPETINHGQTQAQSSIERNIARYLANQSVPEAPPATPTETASVEAAPTTAETATSDTPA